MKRRNPRRESNSRVATLGLLALASCGGEPSRTAPVTPLPSVTAPAEASDAILVLDMSGSMNALTDDGARTRLAAAKDLVVDVLRASRRRRVGVVVFGMDAKLLAAPALEHEPAVAAVQAAKLGATVDSEDTGVGRGLALADSALHDSHGAIVVVTDGSTTRLEGQSHDIDAFGAARTVAAHRHVVWIAQIAEHERARMQDGVDMFNRPHFVDRDFPIDRELMSAIAKTTGGAVLVRPTAIALVHLLR